MNDNAGAMAEILGIVGSPRRMGNTEALVSAALEGAAERGASTMQIWLGELEIRDCTACGVCSQGGQCANNDDMNALYPRLAAARGIIFGTPVYCFGPTGLIKCFLDRFFYFHVEANRPQLAGTAAGLVVPFGDEDPTTADATLDIFRRTFAYFDMPLVGEVAAPGVVRPGDVRRRREIMTAARRLGRKLGALGG